MNVSIGSFRSVSAQSSPITPVKYKNIKPKPVIDMNRSCSVVDSFLPAAFDDGNSKRRHSVSTFSLSRANDIREDLSQFENLKQPKYKRHSEEKLEAFVRMSKKRVVDNFGQIAMARPQMDLKSMLRQTNTDLAPTDDTNLTHNSTMLSVIRDQSGF